MHYTCTEIKLYKLQVDNKIESLLSPNCPADDGALTDIVNQISICIAKAYIRLRSSTDSPTGEGTLEIRLDEIEGHLAEARAAFSSVFGRSQMQDSDSSSMGVGEPCSDHASVSAQCATPSRSGNPDISATFTSLKIGDDQDYVGSSPDLQNSFVQAFAFMLEYSRKMRTELGFIKAHLELFLNRISRIYALFNPSHAGFMGGIKLEELQKSVGLLHGKHGHVYEVGDESLKSVDASCARVQRELDEFERARTHHFS
ncbi:hypothetical protein PAPHI01_0126 [Pancytospora philotis]|nr:hypothetical protein PAPHI01_0126 [Pancytospora philotis]